MPARSRHLSARHFLDTRTLLYSISRDPAEITRRDRAVAPLDRDDGALSGQVPQEFYAQATRATRPDSLPPEIAIRALSCREVYSEDMSHGREVEGVIIVNRSGYEELG